VTAAPWYTWEEEDERIAARYGHPSKLRDRWRRYTRWRWLHRGHKVLDGAYRRERRARAYLDRDLRWFDEEAALANAVRFLESVYGSVGASITR
jgi:hypothetical protein